MIQYYLNEDSIDTEGVKNWVYTVAKNFCIDFHRKDAKDIKLNKKLIKENEIRQEIASEEIEENKKYFSILEDLDGYTFIKTQDKKILRRYLSKKRTLSQLSRDFKIKKNVLKNKIYHAIKEIKFYRLMNTDVVDFDPIPGTKLYQNLRNCLNKVKSTLNENKAIEMKGYFKDCKINDSIKDLHIKEIKAFKIKIDAPNAYSLVVGYKNPEDNIMFFTMELTLKRDYSISITEFPKFPKKVVRIHKEVFNGDTLKGMVNSKGLYNKRYGSFNNMVKNKTASIHQVGTKLVEDSNRKKK